ncbi:hypothetical protein ACJRO7_023074 [Eucalyptus globulus]|uniref:Uncharacterized protein n=1 Tax=Eucalyptus globulus TaxID=34317 RepID=A0ABD3K440_EUCGL
MEAGLKMLAGLRANRTSEGAAGFEDTAELDFGLRWGFSRTVGSIKRRAAGAASLSWRDAVNRPLMLTGGFFTDAAAGMAVQDGDKDKWVGLLRSTMGKEISLVDRRMRGRVE